jgi:hypothetical protein
LEGVNGLRILLAICSGRFAFWIDIKSSAAFIDLCRSEMRLGHKSPAHAFGLQPAMFFDRHFLSILKFFSDLADFFDYRSLFNCVR